jgi:signal transduction histidine kinase
MEGEDRLHGLVDMGRLALERVLMQAKVRRQGEQLGIERMRVEHARRRSEELHAQVVEAEKLRAMGQLASGMVHDLNNLLGAILPHAQLIRLRSEDGEMVVRYADQIQEACEQAMALVDRLSSLANGEHKVVVLGADESVEDVIKADKQKSE